MTDESPDIVRVFEPDAQAGRRAVMRILAAAALTLLPIVWLLVHSGDGRSVQAAIWAWAPISWLLLQYVDGVDAVLGVTILKRNAIEWRGTLRRTEIEAASIIGYSDADSSGHINLHHRDVSMPPVPVDRRILDERENLDWLMALPNLGYLRPAHRRRVSGFPEWLAPVAHVMTCVTVAALFVQLLLGAQWAAWIHGVSMLLAWGLCMVTGEQARLTTNSYIDDPRVSFWPVALSPVSLTLSVGDNMLDVPMSQSQLCASVATLLLVARDPRLRNDNSSILAHFICGSLVIHLVRVGIG